MEKPLEIAYLNYARAVLRENNLRHNDPNTIDLHHIGIKQAVILLKEELETWYSKINGKVRTPLIVGIYNIYSALKFSHREWKSFS